MSNILQVCLYNTEAESSAPLRAQITSLNFVRLVAEAKSPEQLAGMLHEAGINLIFFHLDPDQASALEVVDQVATRFPEIALIGISHVTAPDAILATIRAGCDQFVCEPIDSVDLATAVSRVASKRLLTRSKSRRICVVGASGGAGTTSIACNLAMEVAHLTDKPCGLVDMDFQFGDAAINFDCDPKYTFYDLAESGGHVDRTVLAGVLTSLPCQVHLLARPDKVEQCEAINADVVHHTLDLMATVYETTIVDLPRHVDPSITAALGQADLIIIVCQLLVPSIRNVNRYREMLLRLGIPEERIEVVVNRGDSSGGRITSKDLEETIGKPIFASIPNDYQFVSRSLDFGRPIAAIDRGNPVRAAIGKMGRRILGDAVQESGKTGARRGLLGRLLAK
ncbi:MAG: AAA family ATPase [Planctomycetes bacterium]|nr:AAA family ATPase [Planctomycetota bacterium]